jgi:hypothetical protein
LLRGKKREREGVCNGRGREKGARPGGLDQNENVDELNTSVRRQIRRGEVVMRMAGLGDVARVRWRPLSNSAKLDSGDYSAL